MESTQNLLAEKDLKIIATLLSVNGVRYVGNEVRDGVVFCLFEPYAVAENVVNAYFSQTLPAIQPKRLFESLENARNIVFRTKDQESFKNSHLGGKDDDSR